MRGSTGGSGKDFDDGGAFAPGSQHFAGGESTRQGDATRPVGQCRHARHQAGRDQIIGPGIEAGLGTHEVEDRSGTDQEVRAAVTAQRTDQFDRAGRGQRQLDRFEAGLDQAVDRCFGILAGMQPEDRDDPCRKQPGRILACSHVILVRGAKPGILGAKSGTG